MFDIVDLLLCEMEDIIFDGIQMRRQLAYGHFLCHILPTLFPRHRLQPVSSLPEIYSYYKPPRATDRRLGQGAFQAVQQQMGPEAAAEAPMEDEALAAHDPPELHDLEQLTSDDSSDESYAPPPPRAHDVEAEESQQAPPPPPPSAESSSIATLTRLLEKQQRLAQLDWEENCEIMREMRRQQQVIVDQQQA